MKLKSFSIRNFRSIVDSGVCYVSDSITCLAGMNGSGKSAVLEALSLFGFQGGRYQGLSHQKPIRGDERVEIDLRFTLTKGDVASVEDVLGVQLPANIRRQWATAGLSIRNMTDAFSVRLPDTINEAGEAEYNNVAERFRNTFRQIDSRYSTDYSATFDAGYDWRNFDKAITGFKKVASEGDIEAKALASDAEAYRKQMRNTRPGVKLGKLFEQIGPKIIYIDNTELRNTNPENAAPGVIDRATAIGNTSADSLRQQSLAQRKASLADLSEAISGPIQTILNDDSLQFAIELDSKEIFVGFNRGNAWYSLNQISGGTGTVLSTLLPLLEATEPSIILIDEPDIGLHIDAQRKLLALLQEFGQMHTIIYATHSPFMIPVVQPFAIRLVERRSDGTKIVNNPHDTQHAESMSPIYGAIGFAGGAKSALFGRKNVLLEGAVDAAYLHSVSTAVEGSPFESFSLIPLIGASRAQHIASILEAWRLDYCVLVDADGEGKQVMRTFANAGRGEKILQLFKGRNGCIEDLIAVTDFDALVLKPLKARRRQGEANSAALLRSKISKKLAAVTFANHLRTGVTLSAETIANLNIVVERLNEQFSGRRRSVEESGGEPKA